MANIESVIIYGLLDPRDEQIWQNVRYVGKTKSLHQRCNAHISEALKKESNYTYKERWIRKLYSEGVRPTSLVLEETGLKYQDSSECLGIAQLKKLGCSLTNGTEGGDGISYYTPEMREKARQKTLQFRKDRGLVNKVVVPADLEEANRRRIQSLKDKGPEWHQQRLQKSLEVARSPESRERRRQGQIQRNFDPVKVQAHKDRMKRWWDERRSPSLEKENSN